MASLLRTNKEFNSIYDLHQDASYKNEQFYSISLYWRCQIEALKIRIAKWKPKANRTNSAVFYYDVNSIEEAKSILNKYKEFNFKELQDFYEKLWIEDNFTNKGYFNTGETHNWIITKFLPLVKDKFKPLI